MRSVIYGKTLRSKEKRLSSQAVDRVNTATACGCVQFLNDI